MRGLEGPIRLVVSRRGRAVGRVSARELQKEPMRVSEHGWVTVENAIEILRSSENVFDHLTDITKEVEWNPRTRRVEKLTPAPIGLGTRFSAEWIKGNPTIVEYVRFERPTAWASIARSRRLDAEGEGRISPTEQGSRVVVRTKLRPKAACSPFCCRSCGERCTSERVRTWRGSRRSCRARDDHRRACPRGPPRTAASGSVR